MKKVSLLCRVGLLSSVLLFVFSSVLYAGITSQSGSVSNGGTQTPYFNNATAAINSSNANAKAKQDALNVVSQISDRWSEVLGWYKFTGQQEFYYGVAKGSATFDVWTESGGGWQMNDANDWHNRLLKIPVAYGKPPIGGVEETRLGMIHFTITWPDNVPPVISMSPSTDQVIDLGQSITLTSVATDTENDLVRHHLDWRLPDGRWTWEVPGYNLTTTSNPGAITNIIREQTFSGCNRNEQVFVFTPTEPGHYRIRTAAVDMLGAANWSQEIALTVKLKSPVQNLTVPETVYVGSGDFTLTQTAGNPTAFSHYLVGFKILEPVMHL